MKKIFTLTAAACLAMGMQAQTEIYKAVTLDASGNVVVNADFGTEANPVKEVTTGTANVTVHALTSGAPTLFLIPTTPITTTRTGLPMPTSRLPGRAIGCA